MKRTILLSTTYFGPVHYFTKLLLPGDCIIEIHDHYSKQSYRNRCNIYGANGLLPLSIPVLKGPGHKALVRDIRINNSKNWKKLHWKSIGSAYMHSPFFEYFQDEIRPFYERSYTFLLDLNKDITALILDHLELERHPGYTDDFIHEKAEGFTDFREEIHPKLDHGRDEEFLPVPYHQVFSDRHGFIPNLSIMDLLFNEGPNARNILEACLPKT